MLYLLPTCDGFAPFLFHILPHNQLFRVCFLKFSLLVDVRSEFEQRLYNLHVRLYAMKFVLQMLSLSLSFSWFKSVRSCVCFRKEVNFLSENYVKSQVLVSLSTSSTERAVEADEIP